MERFQQYNLRNIPKSSQNVQKHVEKKNRLFEVNLKNLGSKILQRFCQKLSELLFFVAIMKNCTQIA